MPSRIRTLTPRRGFVNLLRLMPSSGTRGYSTGPPCLFGGPLCARHVSPTLESLPHLVTVLRRRQQVPPGSEVLGNGSIRRQEPLGVDRQKHFIHVPFIPGPRPTAPQSIGILLSKFAAPLTDGFVGDIDAACEQELLHVAVAQGEAIVNRPRG